MEAATATSALAAFSATTATAAGKRLLLSSPSLSLSFASRRRIAVGAPLRAGLLSATPRRGVSASTEAPAVATIAVGDKLRDATLSYFDSLDGELKTVTVRDLTAGKKVVLFTVPGTFTPNCTQKHVPGFVAKAGELRAKGVDTMACVSVNDTFMMRSPCAAAAAESAGSTRITLYS
ncbi:hypothetical protein E2562_014301 [Oryza meyeriana var. granulata]|uniref:glutaredoxin-dependent peroxiredoxin n=1 Tax=Oryza meyeriana var. granulata TaxID=110450 RepID=A0A6G1C697_9ORYZ|nr:hypothetical protein E2562_014301 [Oryza meyeriana var. granulata]